MAIVEDMHHNGRNTTPPLPQAQQQALLSALNPPANARDALSEPSAASVEEATSKLTFAKENIAFYVRHMSSAATPGWSGWTIRFIQRLVLASNAHAEVLQDRLARFFTRWSTGKLHPRAASMFATSRAVLIPKRGGGWRPLCIGDAWYRLISSAIGLLVIKETSTLLLPLQLGSGFSGGGEIAPRIIQLALDRAELAFEDVAAVSMDVKNAFNSIRHKDVQAGLEEFCPQLLPWFHLMYGNPKQVLWSNGSFACMNSTGRPTLWTALRCRLSSSAPQDIYPDGHHPLRPRPPTRGGLRPCIC
jgi:hypothetical protein